MAKPALRTTKEDDNVDFNFLRAITLHIRSSRGTRARNLLIALGALGAECLYTPRIAFATKTQEGNIKCPSTLEDTNSQRPTHIQALSDD